MGGKREPGRDHRKGGGLDKGLDPSSFTALSWVAMGYPNGVRFDWNEQKAAANVVKHGVSFNEAATVLADTLSWTYPDPKHSSAEQRWITVGLSELDGSLSSPMQARAKR